MIKNVHRKLIAAALLALISISLMVTVSYAWYTLSDTPALTGVQITIGGTNTIKIAPDTVVTTESGTYHYPGRFQETLNVSLYDNYDYLQEMAGLMPVSTADGIHWFLPNVEKEKVDTQLESLADFTMDDTLSYANLAAEDENASFGNYAYIDFWVVSPSDAKLRVSGGYEESGSYLINLPGVKKDEGAVSGYTLDTEQGDAAASARVGFLANTLMVTDDSMMHYVASANYDEQYSHLEGQFLEPGLNASSFSEHYNFTIYEPNGNLHTGNGSAYLQTSQGLVLTSCDDGSYVRTTPIGIVDGKPALVDISKKLTVQKTNQWRDTASGNTYLAELLQAHLVGKDLSGKTEAEIAAGFYKDYLQGQYAGYLQSAQFIEYTSQLYVADTTNTVSAETFDQIKAAGATQDTVIVELKKNVPTRIRMFVWLEGQDIDCVREAASEFFAIGIELAGSTQK